MEKILLQRGIEVLSKKEDILPELTSYTEVKESFYHLLKKYAFRIFLRDIIKYRDNLTLEAMSRYPSIPKAKEYLEFLIKNRFIYKEEEKFKLSTNCPGSFGELLEWLVAEIFHREFSAPAIWGVKLKNTNRGGDFDVLTSLSGKLLYIEVKSSPPKGIHMEEIEEFLYRITEISPEMAILFDDTKLRMKDKLVPLTEEAIYNVFKKKLKFRRLLPESELFSLNNCLFIMNSKPDIIQNFRLCIRRFFETTSLYLLLRKGEKQDGKNFKSF